MDKIPKDFTSIKDTHYAALMSPLSFTEKGYIWSLDDLSDHYAAEISLIVKKNWIQHHRH